ncbi:hypothetical protein JHK84_040766 [Glycine max]|nr:hypothetical protein JHK86_040555 [Glycine max]KAG4966169.1 hypothetical protein JHK85_041144 [Glycine max]KAG5122426.1 hypothetical protein JHK84_040766 [Glycine max]
MESSVSHFRASANSFLSQDEPLLLLLTPLLSLVFAHALRFFFHLLSENGLKAMLLGNLEKTIQQIMDMGGGSWDRDTVSHALRAA